jgi:hypothetical protein
VLLIQVLRNFQQIDVTGRIVGVLPALVTLAGVVWLFLFVLE